jgi:iron(III) transport system substrate-binding protein
VRGATVSLILQRVLTVAAAACLALLGDVSSGAAQTSSQIEAAAKAEGTITWYSSLDNVTLNGLVQLFNDSHPGIVLKALQISSSIVPARISTERAAGKYIPDAVTCDQFSCSQLAEAGAFQRFSVANPKLYLKGTIDPKGYWVAFQTDTTVLAWNPQRLKADGLKPPASLADLVKPEWKGKIGIDGSAYNWYQGLLASQKNAQDMLKKIVENKPLITSGHTATITQLMNGEFDVTPTAYGYMAEHARLAGRPIDFLYPTPMPVGLELIAILKNAPHPNGARLLVDWLLSKRAQQFFADVQRTPARLDVKGDERVFNSKFPFFILASPARDEYNGMVSNFKALLGIAG